jgi:hypothetical protein
MADGWVKTGILQGQDAVNSAAGIAKGSATATRRGGTIRLFYPGISGRVLSFA